ncbi:MAG: hypothetical protein ACRDPR_17775 [Nocardioidaceae bacterium]
MPDHRRSLAPVVVAAALLAAGCGSGGGNDPDPSADSTRGDARVAALPANFDLAADSPQAFLLGLIGPEQESIAYGTIELAFTYTGPADRPLPDPRPGPTAVASFLAVSGDQLDPDTPGPRAVSPSRARGVYATEPLTFPDAGFWGVTATTQLDGNPVETSAAFEVLAEHQVPAVGDPAPRTINPVAGDPVTPAVAIDSRAQDGEPIPDPELHATTIAAAQDQHRPVTVVISTPTYCTSRFCGPVTDTVSGLAARYADHMDFVHLEVWTDFENRQINPAAAEWILRGDGDGNEPWVFVVDADGTISHRFDNVANETVLDAAIQEVLQ